MSEPLKGHLSMLVFAALVAGSFALGAQAAPYIDPFVLTALRFVLAATVLWGYILITGIERSAWRDAPWRYVILAVLYAAYFVSMFVGLQTADPVSLSAVFTLTPGITAVLGYAIVSQITTRNMVTAIAIGAVGALWVIFRADFDALLAFEIGRGEAIYFGGCVCHALFSPLIRKFSRQEPTFVFNGCILAISALILVLWSAPKIPGIDWNTLPAIVWVTLAYISVFATVFSLILLHFASLRLPSAKVMAYTYIVPSFVILWQFAMGQTIPTAAILPGVGLTMLSLLMLLRQEEPRSKPARV